MDLSYTLARVYVEQAWEQDKKRRDKIATIISAPVAIVGFIVGVAVSFLVSEGTNTIGVYNLVIPLFVAGVLFTLSSRLIEHYLPTKARDPDIDLAEIEQLDQLRRAEDNLSVGA